MDDNHHHIRLASRVIAATIIFTLCPYLLIPFFMVGVSALYAGFLAGLGLLLIWICLRLCHCVCFGSLMAIPILTQFSRTKFWFIGVVVSIGMFLFGIWCGLASFKH